MPLVRGAGPQRPCMMPVETVISFPKSHAEKPTLTNPTNFAYRSPEDFILWRRVAGAAEAHASFTGPCLVSGESTFGALTLLHTLPIEKAVQIIAKKHHKAGDHGQIGKIGSRRNAP